MISDVRPGIWSGEALMASVLTRKLGRDLWRMKGQGIAVALVVASGVALLIMALSSLHSLQVTADAYYERYRFADVFASLERAPERLRVRIAALPGVQTVETRITAWTTVDIAGIDEPIVANLVSLPSHGEPLLNLPALQAGRAVAQGRDDEAVVLARFADARGLGLDDRIAVLLNGAKRQVRIVGLAYSPEFVYAIGPGQLMPDDKRFAVVWMDRKAIAAAYDLDGAFNNVTLALLRETDPRAVIEQLDRLLDRYGGIGAIARKDQISNWFLMNEFRQLRTMATILPTIFLVAAAFLTNMVLARLIDLERQEIALMKAFGYSDWRIAWHYGQLAGAMAMGGVVLGWGIGALLGWYNTNVYGTIQFQFPFLFFRPGGPEFFLSAFVSIGAALLGAFWAVRRAVAMAPAEAMQPPTPDRAAGTLLPAGLNRRVDHLTRLMLRQIARTPARALVTVIGVSLSIAVLVTSLQWSDAIERLAVSFFYEEQRQDVTVGFFDTKPLAARFALSRLPGVLTVEPMRIVPAEFTVGTRTHRGAVTGLSEGARLQVIYDIHAKTVPVPQGGLALGTVLAEKLGIGLGDTVRFKLLTGRRTELHLPVVALHETYIGTPATMSLAALNRAMDEASVFQFANMLVDPAELPAFFADVKTIPGVSAVMVKQTALDKFNDTLAETMLIFTSFFVAFSAALAMGVVYNATRVALSERGRELATLRVLGFSRAEISYILLGEVALLTLIALPLGCLAGYGLVVLVLDTFKTELFRVPFALEPSTFGIAMLVVLTATALSAALVRRRLDRLDLIAVLKTRE